MTQDLVDIAPLVPPDTAVPRPRSGRRDLGGRRSGSTSIRLSRLWKLQARARATHRLHAAILVFGDVVALTAAIVATRTPGLWISGLVAGLVWRSAHLYARRFSVSLLDDLPRLSLGVFIGWAALAVTSGTANSLSTARTILIWLLFATLARAAAYTVILSRRARSKITFPAVIIGAGETGQEIARRIGMHPSIGLRTLGFLDDSVPTTSDLPAPMLGTPADLMAVADRHDVTDVIVAYGHTPTSGIVDILRACDRINIDIHVVPRLFEMHRQAFDTDSIWGIPLRRVGRDARHRPGWYAKRIFDITFSLVALVVLAPLCLVVALAIRMEMGPGIFFFQPRVGLDGTIFKICKFRSMYHPLPGGDTGWAVDKARVSRVGAILRRYSIDEIPQLVNVLRGHMSLVGPRPERPDFVREFGVGVPRYDHRHRMPAGLTGLAAVQGLRGDTSVLDRTYFDNLYIENWSLWLDIRIICRTVMAVIRGTGT